MSITKILLLLFFIWLSWKIYKFYKRYKEVKQILQQSMEENMRKQQYPLQVKLCQCAYCGVHLPENEAVFDGQTPYCCIEHKRANSHQP